VQGTLATQRKEELHWEIKDQQDQGFDGLLEEDQYLVEVNLEDLENTSGSGEQQEYWSRCKLHGRRVYFVEVLNQIQVAQWLHEMGVWLHNSYLFNQGDRLSIASHSKTVVLKESSPLMRSRLQRCLVITPSVYKDSYKGAKMSR
jgi:hypothetical protein